VVSPFYVTQNACTGVLASGANCTAAVIFQPGVAGAATGSLTVSSPDATVPAIVGLSGTGFDYSLAPSGSSQLTVASGQQADFALTITPAGAEGAFTFQCGTLPSHALCLFNPPSETLNSGVEGNVTVEIYTGDSGSSARAVSPFGRGALPLACAVLLLPLGLWKRRKALLLGVLAAIVASGVASCTGSGGVLGSGSGGQSTGSSTPAGTYTIPVTVSSTGVTHSYNLKLTVD